MSEPYLPESEFLKLVASGDAPLVGGPFGDANLAMLIELTRHDNLSNRDWATMLLAQHEIDTPEALEALIAAAKDEDSCVRGEALQGLAQRKAECALSLLQRELSGDQCGYGTFQAARELADPSLIPLLEDWKGKSGASWIDTTIDDAIARCGCNVR